MTKALFVATCCCFKAHMLKKMFGNLTNTEVERNCKTKEDEESKSIRFNYVAHAKPTEPTHNTDDLCESGGRKSHKANQIK